MINSRLDDTSSRLSDGVLSAVFTLAFSERLLKNELAWNAHLEGLAQMVALRRAQSENPIPQWFGDLILYDAINEAVSSSEAIAAPHKKIVSALRDKRSAILDDISKITEGVSKLRHAIDLSNTYAMGTEFLDLEIEIPVARLRDELQAMRTNVAPSVRALALALNIFLHLSWPSSSEPDLGMLATELMTALERREARLCSSITLTIWQYFTGGVAAIDGHTKAWFLARLREAFLISGLSRWQEVLMILEKAFMPHARLLMQFRLLWEELNLV
ncbi:hypothetical protein G7046_g4879 [Stylonectria norvegica]|nr:hypothetical protein G7046_g4879 [Stylonectria norvegica]